MPPPESKLSSFVALGLVVAVAAGCTRAAAPSPDLPTAGAADDRPNVLVIVTDDQPVGTMSVMPRTRRAFARRGTTLRNMFATTPVCCPARASIMSGRYAHNHGVLTNEDADKLDQDTTIQARLAAAGYRTGLFGKYLNLWQGAPPHFDEWAVIKGRFRYFDTQWDVNGTKRLVEGYWTDSIADLATGFLDAAETDDDRPWLMFVTPPAPHSPYTPAPRHEEADVPRFRGSPATREADKGDKPPYVREASATPGAIEAVPRQQMRSLLAVDDMVGRLIDKIDELGEDDTLAFFVSDNGYLWGEHGLIGAFMSKGNPYPRSVRVPALMRWPGRVAAGERDARLAGLFDITATIADAAGLDAVTDGRSLLEDWRRDRILLEYWQKTGHHRSTVPDWAGLRTRRYSYTEYYDGDEVVFREYYDTRSDRFALENLLGDDDPANDPDVGTLSRQLERDRRCSGESCP